MLIELFVWNHSFWLTSEYTPINIDEIYTETESLLDQNIDYVIGDNSYLEMVFTFFLCIAIIFPLTLKGTDSDGLGTFNKYDDLTHALANGTLYIENNVDERFLTAKNPYDQAERRELGINKYWWDYAYFAGNIYVYFGVVPVILFYLPYYLITENGKSCLVPFAWLSLRAADHSFF